MKRALASLVLAAAVALFALAGSAEAQSLLAATPAATAPTKAPELPRVAAAGPPGGSAKEVSFPEKGKTLSIIVPFAAGGGTDVGARLLAPALGKELGISVQIVNRPGAGSQTGLTQIVNAKPDGYTIGYTLLPTTITVYLDPERKAGFTRKNFEPICQIHVDPAAITVHPDSEFKSLKALVDAAKANPEKVKMAASGIMSVLHLGVLDLERVSGAKFATVHFDGGVQGITALLGKHVDASSNSVGELTIPLKSGKLRVLGIADSKESVFLPGVPTMESQGYKVYMPSSHSLSAPAGTPKEIIEIISGAFKKVLQDSELVTRMAAVGQLPRYLDPVEYGKLWSDIEARAATLMALRPK